MLPQSTTTARSSYALKVSLCSGTEWEDGAAVQSHCERPSVPFATYLLVCFLVDVCLKETMSVADSLYNLQLIQGFSSDYLGGSCFLSLEDLLYMPPLLRVSPGTGWRTAGSAT